jgi:DNA-binding response OmpR family regulator
MRILVVDDLEDAADTLAIYLRMHGYVARTAYDGQTAVQVAGEFRPHAVLLDIALPRLDGYRVAGQLRQDADLQTACLIAVSGYGMAADVNAAYAAGFDHHFIKPVAMEDLLAVLRGLNGRAQ